MELPLEYLLEITIHRLEIYTQQDPDSTSQNFIDPFVSFQFGPFPEQEIFATLINVQQTTTTPNAASSSTSTATSKWNNVINRARLNSNINISNRSRSSSPNKISTTTTTTTSTVTTTNTFFDDTRGCLVIIFASGKKCSVWLSGREMASQKIMKLTIYPHRGATPAAFLMVPIRFLPFGFNNGSDQQNQDYFGHEGYPFNGGMLVANFTIQPRQPPIPVAVQNPVKLSSTTSNNDINNQKQHQQQQKVTAAAAIEPVAANPVISENKNSGSLPLSRCPSMDPAHLNDAAKDQQKVDFPGFSNSNAVTADPNNSSTVLSNNVVPVNLEELIKKDEDQEKAEEEAKKNKMKTENVDQINNINNNNNAREGSPNQLDSTLKHRTSNNEDDIKNISTNTTGKRKSPSPNPVLPEKTVKIQQPATSTQQMTNNQPAANPDHGKVVEPTIIRVQLPPAALKKFLAAKEAEAKRKRSLPAEPNVHESVRAKLTAPFDELLGIIDFVLGSPGIAQAPVSRLPLGNRKYLIRSVQTLNRQITVAFHEVVEIITTSVKDLASIPSRLHGDAEQLGKHPIHSRPLQETVGRFFYNEILCPLRALNILVTSLGRMLTREAPPRGIALVNTAVFDFASVTKQINFALEVVVGASSAPDGGRAVNARSMSVSSSSSRSSSSSSSSSSNSSSVSSASTNSMFTPLKAEHK